MFAILRDYSNKLEYNEALTFRSTNLCGTAKNFGTTNGKFAECSGLAVEFALFRTHSQLTGVQYYFIDGNKYCLVVMRDATGQVLWWNVSARQSCVASSLGPRAYISERLPARMRRDHSCHSLNDRLRNCHIFSIYLEKLQLLHTACPGLS